MREERTTLLSERAPNRNYSSIRGVEVRFTKIPLIATLMAVALSLLIVLPTIAQTSDITDGRGGSGPISVGVFDNINDAQLGKLTASTFDFSGLPADKQPAADEIPYIPVTGTPSPISGVSTAGTFEAAHASYLMNRAVDPQDTFFRSTLYVSNNDAADNAATTDIDEGAYNTILINVNFDASMNTTGTPAYCVLDDATTTEVDESAEAVVRAIVRNSRSGDEAELELVLDSAGTNAQGFVKVVPDDGDTDPTDGPIFCADLITRTMDTNNDDVVDSSDDPDETEVTSATDADIAQIPARHGDRITITVPGQSGTVELTVDGNGPDFTAITPEDNDVTRSSRLTYSFEVRDDDSGLRHDGEALLTEDDDYEEVNPDGDHVTTGEPLSKDPGAAVDANGPAEDIHVRVAQNPMRTTFGTPTGDDVPNYDEISASGTWRIAGSRAGVAYSFSASGADKTDNPYLYQLRARDRAGNWTVTDADDDRDAPGDQPFVFRVDNVDPDLFKVRTGISWDSEDNEETVDRSYLALEFTGGGSPDAIGDVDTDSITVVGHRIVGYTHPSKAPAINRNEGAPDRADYDPVFVEYEPAEPTSTRPSTITNDPDTTEDETAPWTAAQGSDRSATDDPRSGVHVSLLLLEGRWVKYEVDKAVVDGLTTDGAVTADIPAPVKPGGDPAADEPTECATPATILLASAVQTCGEWDQYNDHLARHTTGVSNKAAATARHMADDASFDKSLMPGTNIEGDDFREPRSRVYIELAEELASDETPTVQVVGGAVRDLAGNANDAKTLGSADVEDWIAPQLTVSVTGTAADRAVANAKGAFTVDVMADEDVSRPQVFFVALTATAATVENADGTSTLTGAYNYTIGPATDGTNEANSLTAQESENHWSRAYKVSSPDLSGFADGLVGVIVVTEDDEENTGATAGWSPSSHREAPTPIATNKLNLAKMHGAGLLVEIDRSVDAASKIFVTPRSDADGVETESANPFVKLDFTTEGGEYQVCQVLATEDGCRSGVTVEYKDSHSRVDVAEITVNGDDALADLARIDSNEFSLVLRDLAVGDYEVTYVATDDAGNKSDASTFSFEVFPRQPYKVEVTPGWNLVSLPATPVEPAIADVLANNQYITPVLGYQQGDWITAVREEDGTWRGRLTEITGGFGYWIHARTFEDIETMLSETDPATTLPTVPVTAGWNLLGVLDVHQNDQGMAPGIHTAEVAGDPEADNYLRSIPWRVAYTYDTTASLWVKTVPKDGDTEAGNDGVEITNGTGYWVWSPEPGTLAP